MAKKCKYELKDGQVLSYDEIRAYILNNPPTPPKTDGEDGEKPKLATVAQAFVDSKMPEKQKEKLLSDYELKQKNMTFDEMKEDGLAIINEYGGVEKALELMDKPNLIPIELQSVILGEGMLYYQQKQKEAKTKAEKEKWAELEADTLKKLALKAGSMGRFNAYIQQIYQASPYAIYRASKKATEAKNKLFAPEAKENAKKVVETFENEKDLEESFDQALREAVELSNKERDKKIAELEKKLSDLKKEPKPQTPKNRKYKVDDSARKEALKTLLEFSANPFLDPRKWQALGTLATYHLERGYYKFEDFYNKMKRELGDRYEEYYAELYREAKQTMMESGVPAAKFDSDEDTVRITEEKMGEKERLQEEIARLKKEKEVANLTTEFGKLMSQGIPNLDVKATKEAKLRDIATKLDDINNTDAFTNMVNDFFVIEKKEKQSAEIEAKKKALQKKLSESIPSQNLRDPRSRNEKLLVEAKELDAMIGGNTYENQVQAYINSAKPIGKMIEDALLDSGFSKEVNGKKVVDWKKVTTAGKTSKEVIDAVTKEVEKKYPNSNLGSLLPIIIERVDTLVTEKKKKAVAATVKRLQGYNTRRLINAVKRNTRIGKLVEIWRQGGLTEKEVLEKLGKDFGFTAYTKENEDWIEKKIAEIDAAPAGAEREILEEQLQAYLEDIGAPVFSVKRTRERMKARLLSGPITAFKNLTGIIDAAEMIGYKTIANQISTKGVGDKKAVELIVKDARQKAVWNFLDIFINGGVDVGTALSEQTGTKEGSPSVRYLENERKKLFKELWIDVGGEQYNINPLNKEKYPQRFMSAADTFAHTLLRDIESYTYIKNELMRNNPNMSAKEASQQAYELAYSVQIQDAIEHVAKEFKDRGIPLTGEEIDKGGRARFYRRVHEYIEQQRTKEAVKAGVKFANRYTYKHSEFGITYPIIQAMMGLKSIGFTEAERLKREGLATDNKLRYIAGEMIEDTWGLTFDWFAPFIKSVGNIVEKGLEHIFFYGMAKSAGYGLAAGFNKMYGGKDTEYNIQRAGEYAYRAVIGALVIAAFKMLADDDEEDEKPAIYGEGSPNFNERANRGKQRPANTIRIGDKNIPFDLFGPFAVAFKYEATKLDKERYNNDMAASVLAFTSANMTDTYLQQTSNVVKAMNDYYSNKTDKAKDYAYRQVSEWMTRFVLPFTAAIRQAEQIRDPKADRPLTLMNHIEKQAGVILGFVDGIPKKVDFMGNEYDIGEMYTGGADGFKKMLTGAKKPSKAEELVLKYNPALTKIDQSEESLLTPDEDYIYKPLGSADYFEVMRNSAKKFGSILEEWAKHDPETKAKEVLEGVKEISLQLSDSEKLMGLTANQYEDIKREASTKIKAAGGDPSDKAKLEAKMVEIMYDMELKKTMKNTISELNSLAKKAAIEEYYLSRGKEVPLTHKGAIESYNLTMENLKKIQ